MNVTKTLFREFLEVNYPEEIEIINHYDTNLEDIANISNGSSSKIDDSLGFGESFDVFSNLVAFIFLVASQKAVELGLELSRDKILEILKEQKEKIVQIASERYDNDNIEKILSRIISFLESRKNNK